jgi:hypothetical protein
VTLIYYWIGMQVLEYCDPSSDFGRWISYIYTRDENGCLKITDFKPFLRNTTFGSETKWCGENDVTKRGALHLLG